jgi:predicted acylesterase/phospholipase RssA
MKIGLALSGGGFRATLYHLGLVRFLRDAGILPNVTHITSVSGGSIIAAHLALNWGRYIGSANEFDAAAAELLSFIRLDIRNRIVRRYPLAAALHWPRRLLGLSNRKLTRVGLLEYHYEKFLYGDTSLFQLPEQPRLHLLATNLSEGRLCSFNRDGLWMMRRDAGRNVRIEHLSLGLVTVPMAVAASSAFPSFFPPLELTGADVGARSGEFNRQAYTDGGIFDNLGVRAFRYLAHPSDTEQCSWDGVLVSDVGKPFQVRVSLRAGGIIRTAIRASDILSDRVGQLENDTFKDTPGFVFARITDFVDPAEDPTALHPEIQRQLPSVRTDFDRFSDLEISSLVRQGYTVGRKVCRAHADVFGSELPADPPWDPINGARGQSSAVSEPKSALPISREPIAVTKAARALHASALRRIWSRLLDYRDWVSYVYVPIIIPILVLLPWAIVKSYERSHRVSQIAESLAQGSRDMDEMTRLMEGPVAPFVGEKNVEELRAEDKADLSGFLILQDSRIIDLRNWKPPSDRGNDSNSTVYGYRRLKVQRRPDHAQNEIFRVSVLALSPQTQIRFPPQQLQPRLYSRNVESSRSGEKLVHWEVGADFRKVPVGEPVDLIYDQFSPGLFLGEGVGSNTLAFEVEAETVELTRWLLMPEGKEYEHFKLIRYQTGKPETAERVQVTTEYLAEDFTILAFKLLSLKAGYTYELTWFYR